LGGEERNPSNLRQKKNYGNSNIISPCPKNIYIIIFEKILYLKKNQNPSRYYYNSIITNLQVFNTSQNYHH
jgi:hypothetical protein